ncbi:MAG: YccF domain-containing protein [Synechococcaceae cyanobacterium SM2_3_1]|nr:YccF domain-containing protein [Synechococcaceae cyanobacterium SM2_3_1]
MGLLGNIIWLIFGGLIAALGYMLGGLVLCLTIIGIPFGIQAIKLGFAMLTPFGQEIGEEPNAGGVLNTLFNLVWILVAGWELALNHLFWAVILFISIIGIPFARQHVKMLILSLLPFGRSLRPCRYRDL